MIVAQSWYTERKEKNFARRGRKSDIKTDPGQLRNLADLFLTLFYFNHSCGNIFNSFQSNIHNTKHGRAEYSYEMRMRRVLRYGIRVSDSTWI